MSRVVVALTLVCLLSLTGCGEKEETALTEPSPALSSLIKAERAFAAQVYDKGMRGAFLANLARNSVVFDPKPVDGLRLYEEHEAKPTLLEWEPVFADISRAGRMGYTTGPWKWPIVPPSLPCSGTMSPSGNALPAVSGKWCSISVCLTPDLTLRPLH